MKQYLEILGMYISGILIKYVDSYLPFSFSVSCSPSFCLPFGLEVWHVWLVTHGLHLCCFMLWCIFIRKFYLWSDVESLNYGVDQKSLDEKLKIDIKDRKRLKFKSRCVTEGEQIDFVLSKAEQREEAANRNSPDDTTNQEHFDKPDALPSQKENSNKKNYFANKKRQGQKIVQISSKANWCLFLIIPLLYVGIFTSGLIFSFHKTNPTTYQDCDEVQKHEGENGLYKIDISGLTGFVQCKNGATLIQARNPHGGNQAFFFKRSKEEYEKGFGFTEKEFWLGLDMMVKLNNRGNNVLRVEGIMHNGTEVWVEFDAFRIWNKISSSAWETSYPITSIDQTKSSTGHVYNIIRYNKEHIQNAFTRYNGYGFVTVENKYGQVCPTKQHSSWWYPLIAKWLFDIPSCDFKPNFDTNLNGVYNANETTNKMAIAICNRDTSKCYQDSGNWEILKLRKVQMFLKKSEGKKKLANNL